MPPMTGSSYLLKGGTVVDGSGADPRLTDVRVSGDRIVEVGDDLSASNSRVHSMEGKVLAPGFIDLHAHSEGPLWRDPFHEAKIRQGVTFELLGQDGLGFAPLFDERALARTKQTLMAWHGEVEGLEASQTGLATFGHTLAKRGIAINIGFLVPHGTIRIAAMERPSHAPSPVEMEAMLGLLRTGIREGAFGMSTGLAYAPAMFADTDELIALCSAIGDQGIFVPHLRRYSAGALSSYSEGIEIAKTSGTPLHLTHAVLNGPDNRGAAPKLLALLEGDSAVSIDVYPYDAGSTYLHVLLPSWLAQKEPDDLLAALKETNVRDRLKQELDHVDWSRVKIAGVHDIRLSQFAGHSLAAIASSEADHPIETLCRILTIDRLRTTCVHFNGHLGNIETLLLEYPRCAVASDSILVGSHPHPRGFGTFPRLFESYVVTGRMRLAEAVRRVTSLPAEILGVRDRGLIAPGMSADLVCFDPIEFRDRATYSHPRQFASGVLHLWVNGEPVILDGQLTGKLPGRFVRQLSDL
jgi:N-acyl-D-amino-acid deacylase